MNFLENRIPPPLVALIVAVLIWLAAQWLPATGMPNGLRYGAVVVLFLVGLASSISGARTFRRAGTTLNPMQLENASTLVTGGIYGMTRNPMYLGLTLALSAWAFFLGCLWTLAGPVIFIGYMTRFQIMPEERVLTTKFGDSYHDYCRRVRRWL